MYADIDLDIVRQDRHNFDPTGHYSRPDVCNCALIGPEEPRSASTRGQRARDELRDRLPLQSA